MTHVLYYIVGSHTSSHNDISIAVDILCFSELFDRIILISHTDEVDITLFPKQVESISIDMKPSCLQKISFFFRGFLGEIRRNIYHCLLGEKGDKKTRRVSFCIKRCYTSLVLQRQLSHIVTGTSSITCYFPEVSNDILVYDMAFSRMKDLSATFAARLDRANSEQDAATMSSILKKIQVIMFSSDYLKTYYMKKFPDFSHSMFFVPKGVEVKELRRASITPEFHVVSFSENAHFTIIAQALAMLPQTNTYRWTHISSHHEHECFLKYCNKKLSAKSHISFSHTRFSYSELHNFFNRESVDITIFLDSHTDSVLLLETLSFGVPIIALQESHITEVIHHKKNGLVLPRHFCANDLAFYIETLCVMTPEKKQKMRENTYTTISSAYTRDAYKQALSHVLHDTYCD